MPYLSFGLLFLLHLLLLCLGRGYSQALFGALLVRRQAGGRSERFARRVPLLA